MSEIEIPPYWPAWIALVRAQVKVTNALEEELQARVGISVTWYTVLHHLARARGGRLRMQQLSDLVLLTKSGVTRLVDRMESAGLIRREYDPADGRVAYAVITRRGEHLRRLAHEVTTRGVSEHFAAHLSADELRMLEAAMRRIDQAMDERSAALERHRRPA